MTEKEKMLSGEPYSPFDPDLQALREHGASLCWQIEHVPPEENERRTKLLKELLGRTGESVIIEYGFHCDFGENIELGENFYANIGCIILDCAKITIGDDCMFGPRVTLCAASHSIEAAIRNRHEDFREWAKPITIGNGVWIGAGAIINPGVTIGDRSVIASGAVVTRDVPPDSLAAGCPAIVKKKINN